MLSTLNTKSMMRCMASFNEILKKYKKTLALSQRFFIYMALNIY